MWPLRLALARLRPFNTATVLRIGISALLGALFLWGDGAAFSKLFAAALRVEAATPFFALGLIENLLTLVFLTALFVLFFSALTSSIGALFTDPDLEIYHSSPRSRTGVVLSRFGRCFVSVSWIVILFLSPMFVALAIQYQRGWEFVAGATVLLLLALIPPVALACSLILLLVRFFPVRRIHQIVATLGVLALVLVIVAIRVARPERLFTEIRTDDVVAVLEQIDLPEAERTPAGWLARSVMDLTAGDRPASDAALLAATAAVSIAIFLILARRFYFESWVRAREGMAPVAIGAGAAESLMDRLTRSTRSDLRALLTKEVRVVTRDAAQWSQLFLMLALMFIYLYNIQMMPLEGDARAILLAWLNVGMAGFVIAAICLRFAYPSLSAEGRSFWLIETSPVSYRSLLWIKVFVYSAPLLLLDALLIAAANILLDAPTSLWLPTLGGSLLMTFTLVALGVGMGGLWPDFRRENPMEVALSLGGFAYMTLSLLYVGMVMFLFARPAVRFFVRVIFGYEEPRDWVTRITPLTAALALSFLLAIAPVELAQRRLASRRIS